MASEIIPKEQSSAFQRWQLSSFDRPAPAAPTAPPAVEKPSEPAAPIDQGEPVDGVPLPTAEDIERIHEEARAEGYAAGLAEGREAGEQASREAAGAQVAHLARLIENAEQSLAALDQSVAESVLELALSVARQLTRASIAAKPDFMLPVIREALAMLPLHHSHVVIHLHPDDAAQVRPLLGEHAGQTELRLVEDSQISPGGCRLLAGTSEVDATIETRWQRVLETIGSTPQAWLNQN